ncbi:MAG TPA: SUMF1/EgtB/PvdO family nonheme iron enzyme [Myxococcota bacterium]|nr:SUMF1/EgtB/PvdO family nonheme iron enzyme [Myxococcota bacterium]HRY97338.1 SUMF1/EgtB/PvdO family nonheme iron enzyme [Myxococcota bacterium]
MRLEAASVVAALALLLLVEGPVQAQDRPIVAVFDLEVKGTKLDKGTVDRLTDYLGSLLASKGFQVVPRAQLKERLVQAKKGSYKACYDESCQIEVGKELAAQKTLASQILKLGSKCKVTLNLLDLKKAASEGAGTASGKCGEDEVVESLEKAVANMFEGAGAPPPKLATAQPGDTGYAALAAQAAGDQQSRQAGLLKAWQEVSLVAIKKDIPHKARALALKKFLEDFPTENPHTLEARLFLWKLDRGEEFVPEGSPELLEWVVSSPARVEFTRSEVTVAQYRACVESGACEAPTTDAGCNWAQPDREAHPANCVGGNNAAAYCTWAGGRLPSDDEWYAEASERGRRKYPWGDQNPSCDLTVLEYSGKGCGKDSTWPVCSKPAGNSVSGLCDMSGNVMEWTATGSDAGLVLRGGSWHSGYYELSTSYRFDSLPLFMGQQYGFRCVRSAQ